MSNTTSMSTGHHPPWPLSSSDLQELAGLSPPSQSLDSLDTEASGQITPELV